MLDSQDVAKEMERLKRDNYNLLQNVRALRDELDAIADQKAKQMMGLFQKPENTITEEDHLTLVEVKLNPVHSRVILTEEMIAQTKHGLLKEIVTDNIAMQVARSIVEKFELKK